MSTVVNGFKHLLIEVNVRIYINVVEKDLHKNYVACCLNLVQMGVQANQARPKVVVGYSQVLEKQRR